MRALLLCAGGTFSEANLCETLARVHGDSLLLIYGGGKDILNYHKCHISPEESCCVNFSD